MSHLQADPLQQSWDKRTPLHFAAQHRHPAVIRQLLLHPTLRQHPHPQPQPQPQFPLCPTAQQPPQPQTSDQDLDMIDDIPSESQPHAHNTNSAQTEPHSRTAPQRIDGSEPDLDNVQDAANSLQSLQSGIQYEPYAAGTVNRPEADTFSNGSVEAAEQLDYTREDADAMDALLALTNDCSVQSPPRRQNPAGESIMQS